jgi:molybdopterin molybdotransferase
MISVAEATQRIAAAFKPVAEETVALADADGRVLSRDIIARRTQPPCDISAMDGWAIRAADATQPGAQLAIAGQSAAGNPFEGHIGAGQAVRIFTGAWLPEGADAIVIQEDAGSDGATVTLNIAAVPGRHIRRTGIDFRADTVGLTAGTRLGFRQISLAAAMNHAWLPMRRRPRIALLATGDELARPGEPASAAQIVNSNTHGLSAFIRAHGGEPVDLGIAPDREAELAEMALGARGCDLLVTLGGASVGDHDLVRKVLADGGAALDFWKIAMRPGKPLMFGMTGTGTPLLGLPGNPVSALVTALLFLRPAMAALLDADDPLPVGRAKLGRPLPANDMRQDYIRAKLDPSGTAMPFPVQDSSMLTVLARSHCLIVRAPDAPEAQPGDEVEIVRLD